MHAKRASAVDRMNEGAAAQNIGGGCVGAGCVSLAQREQVWASRAGRLHNSSWSYAECMCIGGGHGWRQVKRTGLRSSASINLKMKDKFRRRAASWEPTPSLQAADPKSRYLN